MAFASRSHDISPRFIETLLRAFGFVFACFVISTQPTFGQNEAMTKPASAPMNAEQRQSDASFAEYKFRDGETLPKLRIHYVILGRPHKDARGNIDNAVLVLHWTNATGSELLTPEYQKALFAHGAPIDASRFYVIIPDDVGHGASSKPSNGLKATFPHYGYADMVDIQHKLVTESLGIEHLHAIVGMSMGCMNAWQWAEAYPDVMDGIMPIACFPAAISGRNLLWRRMLIDGIRSDPLWENGNYQKQPPSGATGLLLARMMIDGVPSLQQEVRSPEAADGFIRGVKAQAGSVDTNDLLYAFESSRDFNAEPDLSFIKTKVFALNFADDEFYRDSLQILQADLRQVHQGKLAVRTINADSAGHFSMSHPGLWKDYVSTFMNWIGTDKQSGTGLSYTIPPNR